MDWYIVIKTINGRRYRYRQKTWRENGRVRTRSEYIGPAGDACPEPKHPDLDGASTLPLPFAATNFDSKLVQDALEVLTDKTKNLTSWEQSWQDERRGKRNLVVRNAVVETLIASLNVRRTYRNAGPYYRPLTDEINTPPMSRFINRFYESATEAYYSILLHELVHWTKSAARTGRLKEDREDGYAREELVAELGAVALAKHLGIASDNLAMHSTYFQIWLSRVEDREESLAYAKYQAERAARYILERGIIS